MSVFDEPSRLLGENEQGEFGAASTDGGSMSILELHQEAEIVVLKEWTAQDFSHTYVRLRPHLERHAARFLRDPSQIEEVVQDAFLYLMTALPDLDSEIGVLRFLKWKTKMLALDIIRINSKYSVSPIEDHEHYLENANQDELGLELERADDSAVVSLALAKLSPRQRRVIVETQLLEKPIETVARDMGLSSNALRQLLHRARAAFKVALVGEAEVNGLPASAILTLAAKKAARESGKLIAGASASLLAIFGIVSFGSISPVGPAETVIISMPIAERPIAAPSPNAIGQNGAPNGLAGPPPGLSQQVVVSSAVGSELDESRVLVTVKEPDFESQDSKGAILADSDVVAAALTSAVDEFVALMDFATETGFDANGAGDVVVRSGDGLSASFGIDEQSEDPVQFVYLTLQLPVGEVVAVPTNGLTVVEDSDRGTVLHYAATDFIVGDFSGALGNVASAETSLVNSKLLVSLLISEQDGMQVLNFDFQTKGLS